MKVGLLCFVFSILLEQCSLITIARIYMHKSMFIHPLPTTRYSPCLRGRVGNIIVYVLLYILWKLNHTAPLNCPPETGGRGEKRRRGWINILYAVFLPKCSYLRLSHFVLLTDLYYPPPPSLRSSSPCLSGTVCWNGIAVYVLSLFALITSQICLHIFSRDLKTSIFSYLRVVMPCSS